MTLLSALVVVRNEEAKLEACLACLGFADEIVVVLDRCTDGSAALAGAAGARCIEGAWPIEGERRAVGQAACQGRWVFELDADERVSPALAAEILSVLEAREAAASGPSWWRVPVDNYIGARLVRYGWGASFGASFRATLYRRGAKNWGAQRVHPRVRIEGDQGPVFKNPIAHFVDPDITAMVERLNRYSSAHALDLQAAGDEAGYLHNILRIFGRFWKCFVLRKGYREGPLGLLIALCAGLYPYLSFVKRRELESK